MASRKKSAAMKKEIGEKSSRPSSSRTSPRGSIGNVGQSAPMGLTSKLKQLQETMTKENAELLTKVESLTTENKEIKEKLQNLTARLIEDSNAKGIELSPEDKKKQYLEVPIDSLLVLLNDLAYGQEKKKKKAGTVEARIEELETRITHLNMELAKLLQLRLNSENTLQDIQNCDSIEEVHKKARFMLFEIQGSELFTFLAADDNSEDEEQEKKEADLHINIPPPQYRVETIMKDLQTFELYPPTRKYPGDTHISKMDVDLRKYLINELSLYKGNGADWRMIAERVGITTETIQQWKRWKLEYPMQYVMDTWSKSSGASVRMLHRHLVSPQMRAILLAKRISDFYQVD